MSMEIMESKVKDVRYEYMKGKVHRWTIPVATLPLIDAYYYYFVHFHISSCKAGSQKKRLMVFA